MNCNVGNRLPYPGRWNTIRSPSPPSPSSPAATAGRLRASSRSLRRCAPAAASSRPAGASACRARAPTSSPAGQMPRASARPGGRRWPGRARCDRQLPRPRRGKRNRRRRTRPDHQLPKRNGRCRTRRLHQLPRRKPAANPARSPLIRWPSSCALPVLPEPCAAWRQRPRGPAQRRAGPRWSSHRSGTAPIRSGRPLVPRPAVTISARPFSRIRPQA